LAGIEEREKKEFEILQDNNSEIIEADIEADIIEEAESVKEENPLVLRGQEPIDPSSTLVADTEEVPKFCNGCYLADRCPKCEPNATCFYRVKAKIESPADMVTVMRKILEIQAERVMFGRHIEQMEGGYIDKTLSDEMKRLMEMMKDFRDVLDTRDEVKVSIKAKGKDLSGNTAEGGKSSILQQIFGNGNQG
jgi:hypothetical protein